MNRTFTICGMCRSNTCGLEIIGDGRRISDVRGDHGHPFSRGRICPMARAALELQDAPDRLDHPLRRTVGDWKKIDWDSALTEISTRLEELRSRHGAQCLAVYQGHALLPMIRQGWVDRFLNLFGTPNLVRNDHLCAVPTTLIEEATFGHSSLYGFDPTKSGTLILWGINPATSAFTTLWHRVIAAHLKGTPLVVIDPRKTIPARQARNGFSLPFISSAYSRSRKSKRRRGRGR
jgi:anaerobic selenocysteine-containing dehydrogenase